MQSTYLIQNTFVVKDGESFVVYSPYSGKIVRTHSFPKEGSKLFLRLCKAGFFGALPETVKKDSVETWKGFRSLTLLVSRICNLACVYCYASSQSRGRIMDLQFAKKALNWFVDQLQSDTIRITFHGGGEPTLNFSLIQKVVAEAKAFAEKTSKKTRFQIVTNGTAGIEKTNWLINNNFGISISADGPESIQNRNRPFANGKGSSAIVERTIEYLVTKKYPFTIRLTFSPLDDIEEIIRYFGRLGVKSIHIEPLFPHGREYSQVVFGKKNGGVAYSPNGSEFITSFFKAMDIAKKFEIKLTNSHLGHFIKGLGYFCGSASGRSMIVTDDGFVSSCLEVVDVHDADFEMFRLGRFSHKKGLFVIDKTALARFQSRHSDTLPSCKHCFARYVCSGGCAVKAVRASEDFMKRDMPYCVFTKSLIPELIKRIANLSRL